MLQILDVDKLKFTKIRHHRINFRYNEILYSLNLHEDGGEHSLNLDNRNSNEFIVGDPYETNIIFKFIKINYYLGRTTPIIYKHIDKEYFAERMNDFIKNNS